MHIVKIVNSSSVSTKYLVFIAIAKRILDEPSPSLVIDGFDDIPYRGKF